MANSAAGSATLAGRIRKNTIISAAGLGILASVLVIGLVVAQSLREREVIISEEKESLVRMAQIASVQMNDMLDQIRFFFLAADFWLSTRPNSDPRFDPDFRRLVDDFRATIAGNVEIRLVSEGGGLYNIPSTSEEPLMDVGDRSYFLAQGGPETRGFFVGDTVPSRVTGVWGIPISYPLSSRNGGISVIFAVLEIPTFESIYEDVRPKPGGSVSLMRRDGLILARVPFDPSFMGRRVAEDADQWWRDTQATPILVLRAASTDNIDRIIATKHINDPDLAVNVSASMLDILAEWERALISRIATGLGLIAAIALVSIRLLAALRRQNAAQAELSLSLERLRESDATKDKLISILGHDLRSPIGGISNLLDAMAADLDGLTRDELGEFISALRKSARSTTQLLENILAWARSMRKDAATAFARTRLKPLIEECVELHALSISDKNLSLSVEIENSLEARVDPELFKVVMRNLISNAVKFSRAGGSIRVSAARDGPGALVSVRDEGIGMDEATIAGLFEPGASKCRPGTASERGSGLGLILCKDIVERHGGALEAAGEVGAGSSFSFFLPD